MADVKTTEMYNIFQFNLHFCYDQINIRSFFLSDSTENSIYCDSSQHQPYLGHQASSKSKVLPDWTY